MATDYDAPRNVDPDAEEDSIDALKAGRAGRQSSSIDVDDVTEPLDLPGADLSSLSAEELTVRVVPRQDDEFTCTNCFLVHHRSRIGRKRVGQLLCRDCA